MEVKEFIEKNLDSMKQDLGKLVSFNSIYRDDMPPFGSTNHQVLDCALNLMQEKGLKPTNLDYYCGYGEVGTGDKLVGILAHLDVVPAGDGWDSDPFEMVEKDGKLYGRGVSDDKGAAIASMYALKYLIDEKYPFKKRIRLILGCNEETGSLCIKHYVEKCGQIDYGFTPDGEFPGIYAEKGMVGGALVGHHSKIKDIVSGEATNVVPKKVVMTLPENCFDENKLKDYFAKNKISYEYKENKLTVYGKAAHASTPDLGINAVSYAFEGLYYADFNDSFVTWFHEHFGLTTHGELLGYDAIKDEITNTSINIGGMCFMKGNDVCVSLDERCPVKTTPEIACGLLTKVNTKDNEFVAKSLHNSLYFDLNSPMIKALKKAYEDVTGDHKSKMEAIGGGTYAKAINNCIAFGCEFVGDANHIHDANESLRVQALKDQVEIYIEAIKNLNEI